MPLEPKAIKRIVRAALTLLALAAALGLELTFMPMPSLTLDGRIIFYVLLNLNLLALAGILYLVVINVAEVVEGWWHRRLGYKFKTRLVGAFLTLTAIPMLLMFMISGSLGTNYIDRFFTPQFRESAVSAMELAGAYYEEEREEALRYAEAVLDGGPPPPGYKARVLIRPSPDYDSPAIEAAFRGEARTEIQSTAEGDLIRAVIPRKAAGRKGVLILEGRAPEEITRSITRIKDSYENYTSLEALKAPIKLNYLLLLGFFTLLIIFSALYVSIRIATWITEPVKSLAEATKEVASGNLNVHVKARRNDEMGLLIESFNDMIGEMRHDKESLLKAYLNLDNIVKNINTGVISIDERGFVREINGAACRILGVSEGDVRGRFYETILEGMQSQELHDTIKGINIRSFRHLERELRVRLGAEGPRITIRVSITGLKGPRGEHLGLLVVVDDLSDLIKAQRALAWQEVARRMAHEIKNPLTPIKLSTERMVRKWSKGDDDFGAVFERSTGTIIREVEGLKHLVDEFSRLGRLPEVKKAPTPIETVISEAANLYKGYPDLEIEVTYEEGLRGAMADLDPGQFKRAIINLIDNAREAMDNRGAIALMAGLDPQSGRLVLSVSDTGPGIAPEDMERLFQPYFSTKKHGTGLGLVIADKIIAEHGGTIRVGLNRPHGTVFTIEIPIEEA